MGADVKERGAERQRGPHHQSHTKTPAPPMWEEPGCRVWFGAAPDGGYSSSLTMPTRSNFSVEMTTS